MYRFLSVASAAPLLLISASAHAAATTSAFAQAVRFDPMIGLLIALAAVFAAIVILPRSFRGALGALAVLVTCSMALDVAFAADAAPETIAQSVSESTKVTWAWGATVSQAGQAIAWILASIAMVLLRQLPANIVAIFGNARVELLLNNAIGYGLNAVQGAVKDKTLSVDVGNEVLAKALQYAVDNAPAWLQSWAGGPEGLAKKIWARLNLGEGASDAALPSAVSTVSAP
jgi:hypothetical protein